MVQLKRNLLSVALASATMMLAAQAHAQSAPPQRAAPYASRGSAEAIDADKLFGAIVKVNVPPTPAARGPLPLRPSACASAVKRSLMPRRNVAAAATSP